VHTAGVSPRAQAAAWCGGPTLSRAPLSPEGIVGPGTDEVEPLLDKHEDPNCVSMKASAPERNGVPPTREDPFDSDGRSGNAQNVARQLKEAWKLAASTYPPLNGVASIKVFGRKFKVLFQFIGRELFLPAIPSREGLLWRAVCG
jgi:hypothetical protein